MYTIFRNILLEINPVCPGRMAILAAIKSALEHALLSAPGFNHYQLSYNRRMYRIHFFFSGQK
jgi:hypothetical protein